MRKEKISNALTNIDDKYIEEAGTFIFKKKKKFHFPVAIAACFCMVIALWQFGIITLPLLGGFGNDDSAEQYAEFQKAPEELKVSEDEITLPQMVMDHVSEKNMVEADLLAFFIYQGKSYVEYNRIDYRSELVGNYLGSSSGDLTCWNLPDSYVEGTGSVKGDFYEVNGYDPTFMLCMVSPENELITFINDNDFAVKYGSEIFENRLHLSQHYESVSYQTRNDWYHSIGAPTKLDETHYSMIDNFIHEINQAEWMLLDDIPLEEDESNVYDSKEIYHLFFAMSDGLTVHLRLFEGGYVSFQGIHQICVQIDETVFDDLIQVLY